MRNVWSALAVILVAAHIAFGQISSKISVAVMNLKNASGVSADDADLLSDRLRIELFNTGRFGVMERSQMQEILKEQGFQHSGACTDEGCMVEMGQVLGVSLLIGGSIGRLGGMYLVNIRAIDVKTAKIVAVVSEDIEGDITKLVRALPQMSARLAASQKSSAPATAPAAQPAKSEPPRAQKAQPGKAEPVAAVSEPTPVPEPEPQPEPASEPEPVSSDAPECDEKVYLEKTAFTAEDLRSSLTSDEMTKLNDDITGELEERLDECLMGDVDIQTRENIAAMSGCKAIIIRITLEDYTTKAGSRNQVVGTATVTFSYFEGTDATTPFHQEKITESGAQHWGEYEPFQNAFEEIAETIMDHDMGSYMRLVRGKIRKL